MYFIHDNHFLFLTKIWIIFWAKLMIFFSMGKVGKYAVCTLLYCEEEMGLIEKFQFIKKTETLEQYYEIILNIIHSQCLVNPPQSFFVKRPPIFWENFLKSRCGMAWNSSITNFWRSFMFFGCLFATLHFIWTTIFWKQWGPVDWDSTFPKHRPSYQKIMFLCKPIYGMGALPCFKICTNTYEELNLKPKHTISPPFLACCSVNFCWFFRYLVGRMIFRGYEHKSIIVFSENITLYQKTWDFLTCRNSSAESIFSGEIVWESKFWLEFCVSATYLGHNF